MKTKQQYMEDVVASEERAEALNFGLRMATRKGKKGKIYLLYHLGRTIPGHLHSIGVAPLGDNARQGNGGMRGCD